MDIIIRILLGTCDEYGRVLLGTCDKYGGVLDVCGQVTQHVAAARGDVVAALPVQLQHLLLLVVQIRRVHDHPAACTPLIQYRLSSFTVPTPTNSRWRKVGLA
jgi:hypothetical protein